MTGFTTFAAFFPGSRRNRRVVASRPPPSPLFFEGEAANSSGAVRQLLREYVLVHAEAASILSITAID